MQNLTVSELRDLVQAGKVVQYNGRSAASLAEFDDIVKLKALSDESATVKTYDHGVTPNQDALQSLDLAGQNAQPFSPQHLTEMETLRSENSDLQTRLAAATAPKDDNQGDKTGDNASDNQGDAVKNPVQVPPSKRQSDTI